MQQSTMQHCWTVRMATLTIAAAISVSSWAASPTVEKMVFSGQPTGKSVGVVEAKTNAKDGEKVIVQGRIKDFVDGQAVFTLTDNSLKSCTETGDQCPTPWDFCCNPKDVITKNTASVKINGQDGKVVKENVKGVYGLTNLSPITVEGVAKKDKAGNLTVVADKIVVKK